MRPPSISLAVSPPRLFPLHHHYHQAAYITTSAYIACILLCSTTPPSRHKEGCPPQSASDCWHDSGQRTDNFATSSAGQWVSQLEQVRAVPRNGLGVKGSCVGQNCAVPPAEVELTQMITFLGYHPALQLQ